MRAGLKPARDGRVRVDVVTADRLAGTDATILKAYELVVTVGLSAAQATIERRNARSHPRP